MITVNTEHYPFVLSSYRGDQYPEAMLRGMFAQMAEIARKSIHDGTRHVAVTLGGANMNAAQRKIVAELLAAFPAEYMDRTIGSFVIVPSAVVRGAMTALRWISPKLVQVESVATVDDALRDATARLRERGVAVDEPTIIGARRWLNAQARLNPSTSSVGA
jgi:hypothetical protein